MNRYIQQLIEDFAKVEANPIPDPNYETLPYDEFEKEMMKLEEGKQVSGNNLLNVSYEELPPPEKLTDEQTKLLLDAILKALTAKGVCICFPGNNAPVKLKYYAIKNLFKEGFQVLPGWVQDFCSGYCPGCDFAYYCNIWQDLWTKEEFEKERKNTKF
ncbi:MAG: hypothetical protein PHW82_13845 [Bacteroidales bacterium]|nr:hypothetical protein [Bacteroidales bacterium]